jgi:nickel transport protein
LLATVVAVCLLLAANPALAHRLKVFAAAVGPEINGQAYFVGGGGAAGAQIRIEDSGGRELATLAADEQGRFRFTATVRLDHRIVADAGDGHSARFVVPARDLPPSLPAPAGEGAAAIGEPPPAANAPPAIVLPTSQLRDLVGEAVAQQILPLRQQIMAYEDRVRLHDVLGGIGVIVGVAGLALWSKARRLDRSRR